MVRKSYYYRGLPGEVAVFDLPVWQALFREYEDRNFVIVAVALDTGGPDAVREFIRPVVPIVVPGPMKQIMSWTSEQWANASPPTYPCLIDEKHVVAALYDMPNVPMAVWIDEQGTIVRPAEPAGASDGFRSMDRTTFTMPPDVADAGRSTRARYIAAIRDWIEHGAASRYALSAQDARERIVGPAPDDALASASFALGTHLRERGNAELARRWFDRAQRLAPERWTLFRQALQLEERGKASGPEFFARVTALGDRPYYPRLSLEPESS